MAKYTIDHLHSNIQFKVKHLMISTVTGDFKDYSVNVVADNPDFTDANISFEALVASIATGNEQRDGHLKSDDFFNAEKYPTIHFVSTSVSRDGNDITIQGNLTIRETTKAITLTGVYEGTMVDFYGNTKVGFEIEGKIKRKEFGLQWDAVTEAGGVVVSDDVKLVLQVQLQELKEVAAEVDA
jgi:polyisoprenoid-binding protein YceI